MIILKRVKKIELKKEILSLYKQQIKEDNTFPVGGNKNLIPYLGN